MWVYCKYGGRTVEITVTITIGRIEHNNKGGCSWHQAVYFMETLCHGTPAALPCFGGEENLAFSSVCYGCKMSSRPQDGGEDWRSRAASSREAEPVDALLQWGVPGRVGVACHPNFRKTLSLSFSHSQISKSDLIFLPGCFWRRHVCVRRPAGTGFFCSYVPTGERERV